MKKRLMALLLMFSFFTVGAYAANQYQKTIDVSYDVNLSINGQSPKLTDVNGNTVLPFTYQGTTYVPIRAVGDQMGANISYDSSTKTAKISSQSSASSDVMDDIYNRNMYTLKLLDSCVDLNTHIYTDTLLLDTLLLNSSVTQTNIDSSTKNYTLLSQIKTELAKQVYNSSDKTSYYYEDLEVIMYALESNFNTYGSALSAFTSYHTTNDISYAYDFLDALTAVRSAYYDITHSIDNVHSEFWS
ncbi:stalk domain-containing protein [Agathobaculum sp. NTUH-O15-33]|uniref:stalk domain-containing protein n=1 Tax=Agathobaculum sp. NTUH-O15-33 TaxID=3079302 RepID=UPI002958345C|nr:stalk domain-containing protein [Agathobaculum sp. NTUH-O15-33]WNX85725.1 stalk domain-containing protein [Agathobaculum sp. NTUH-O15-33]